MTRAEEELSFDSKAAVGSIRSGQFREAKRHLPEPADCEGKKSLICGHLTKDRLTLDQRAGSFGDRYIYYFSDEVKWRE